MKRRRGSIETLGVDPSRYLSLQFDGNQKRRFPTLLRLLLLPRSKFGQRVAVLKLFHQSNCDGSQVRRRRRRRRRRRFYHVPMGASPCVCVCVCVCNCVHNSDTLTHTSELSRGAICHAQIAAPTDVFIGWVSIVAGAAAILLLAPALKQLFQLKAPAIFLLLPVSCFSSLFRLFASSSSFSSFSFLRGCFPFPSPPPPLTGADVACGCGKGGRYVTDGKCTEIQ